MEKNKINALTNESAHDDIVRMIDELSDNINAMQLSIMELQEMILHHKHPETDRL